MSSLMLLTFPISLLELSLEEAVFLKLWILAASMTTSLDFLSLKCTVVSCTVVA